MPNKYWALVIEVLFNDGWDEMALAVVGCSNKQWLLLIFWVVSMQKDWMYLRTRLYNLGRRGQKEIRISFACLGSEQMILFGTPAIKNTYEFIRSAWIRSMLNVIRAPVYAVGSDAYTFDAAT